MTNDTTEITNSNLLNNQENISSNDKKYYEETITVTENITNKTTYEKVFFHVIKEKPSKEITQKLLNIYIEIMIDILLILLFILCLYLWHKKSIKKI